MKWTWLLLMAVATGACASTGGVPRPFPGASAGDRASPERARRTADGERTAAVDTYALVGTALSLRGTRYRNGGSDPAGFDCSGFTQYVFSRYGLPLPREVSEQYRE